MTLLPQGVITWPSATPICGRVSTGLPCWSRACCGRIRSPATSSSSEVGKPTTIRYALSRWPALCLFLDDGRIDLDNNPVERAIRPVALGRKNHLFAGSDGGGVRWATVCSLVATAKLNDVEPFAYLKDVLERMTYHPMSRLDDLLPWNWAKTLVKQ
jgi:Transposase IS66 family/IS66 C-terminal element